MCLVRVFMRGKEPQEEKHANNGNMKTLTYSPLSCIPSRLQRTSPQQERGEIVTQTQHTNITHIDYPGTGKQ